MTEKTKLKNAFVKVAGNDNWYRSVDSRDEVKEGEYLVILDKSPLSEMSCNKHITAFNQYDLLLRKAVAENKGVKDDFAGFIAGKIVADDKKILKVLENIEVNLAIGMCELLKEVNYDLNVNPYYTKRINILSDAAFAVSGIQETLTERNLTLFDNNKKIAIVDKIKNQSGEVLIGLANDLKLPIGGKNGFDVVSSVMNNAKTIGINAFKVGSELRVKKDFIARRMFDC